jgi:tRNA pseudouridine32 synthase/23S rRNA pseudouridine746 synthase
MSKSLPTPADNFIAPHCAEDIEVLEQDQHILLINKPSGLLSLSGKNPLNIDSVHHRLVQQFPNARLAHRLDLGTSGVMLIALNKAVNAKLSQQFQERSVEKTYISILAGHLPEDEGYINLPICKDLRNFPLQKICQTSGKAAQSHYRVLERLESPARSRVIFTPLTGRTHQLRIHSRELGHPILGCDLYGSPTTRALAPRLLLHANRLSFHHPISNKRLTIYCPSPF